MCGETIKSGKHASLQQRLPMEPELTLAKAEKFICQRAAIEQQQQKLRALAEIKLQLESIRAESNECPVQIGDSPSRDGPAEIYLKCKIIPYLLRESFKSPIPPLLRESFKSSTPPILRKSYRAFPARDKKLRNTSICPRSRHFGAHVFSVISYEEMQNLSTYADNLKPEAKDRYLRKISTIGGADPFLNPIPGEIADCVPSVEVCDLVSYLVLKTSFVTSAQFKARKGLEAYNHFVSGWIKVVNTRKICGKYLTAGRVSLPASKSLLYNLLILLGMRRFCRNNF